MTLAIGFALITVCAADAATFTVSRTANAGAGSLRQAVADAAANAGDDTIVFAPSLDGQTITLASEIRVLTANGAMTISGLGGNLVGNNTGNAAAIFPVGNPNANNDRVGGAGATTSVPGVFPLANNGGNVPTMALSGNSLAVNNGVNANAVDPFTGSPLQFDARGTGFPRFIGNVDIGALESFNPTAAGVSLGGRVMVGKGGLTNAIVVLTDQNGTARTVKTTSFGYYRFDGVASGQTVIVTVVSKRFQFDPQIVSVGDNVTEPDVYTEPE